MAILEPDEQAAVEQFKRELASNAPKEVSEEVLEKMAKAVVLRMAAEQIVFQVKQETGIEMAMIEVKTTDAIPFPMRRSDDDETPPWRQAS